MRKSSKLPLKYLSCAIPSLANTALGPILIWLPAPNNVPVYSPLRYTIPVPTPSSLNKLGSKVIKKCVQSPLTIAGPPGPALFAIRTCVSELLSTCIL